MRLPILLLLFLPIVCATINYAAVFDRYVEVWEFDNFWKRASTVDAALRFISVTGNNESHLIMRDILTKNLDYYYEADHSSVWADDFGWWGLLSIRAHVYLMNRKDWTLAHKYAELARDSWKMMLEAGYDFDNNSYSSYPVPHGCANSDNTDKIGTKNTVTNALLFLLSVRLYRTFGGLDYLSMLKAQWTWFSSWFRLEKFQYLHMIHNDSGLVLERPFGGNYTDVFHPDWELGRIWSGDQGLLLTGLIESPLATSYSKQISEYLRNGIKEALIGPDLIFREAPFLQNYAGEYAHDYFAGRGIMIRNLNCQTIEYLKVFINVTANAMWKTRVNNQFVINITSSEDDLKYTELFCNLWGRCDHKVKWTVVWEHRSQRDAIIQAMGMDFLATVAECLLDK